MRPLSDQSFADTAFHGSPGLGFTIVALLAKVKLCFRVEEYCFPHVAHRAAADIFRYPHHPADYNDPWKRWGRGLLPPLRCFETSLANPDRRLIFSGVPCRRNFLDILSTPPATRGAFQMAIRMVEWFEVQDRNLNPPCLQWR